MAQHFSDLQESIFAEMTEVTEAGCWRWLGWLSNGYGRAWVAGRQMMMHRASWLLYRGPIPDGMYVCHHCDNPPCCNPDHLFVGTARDNFRDAVAKGRHPGRFLKPGGAGVRRVRKLTDQQVLFIASSTAPGRALAKMFGVGDATISRIRRGQRKQIVTGIGQP